MGTFADCTYNIVSSKAWKVTIVRTECYGSAFQRHFFRMVLRKRLPYRGMYTLYCESSISLEGGRSKDRLRLCRFLHVISRMSTLEIVFKSKR